MIRKEIEILLAEDNPADLELTLHAFRQNRLANTIQVARDGAEVLDFLFRRGAYSARSNSLPRLVLLDLKLPKVDGLEVLQAIRSDERTRLVPVVVLTSSKEQRDIVESYRLGVNSYLQKPVSFDQFQEMIRELGYYWLLANQVPATE
ncbi:MAG: response regulator [Terriglobia bacterium]